VAQILADTFGGPAEQARFWEALVVMGGVDYDDEEEDEK
jgi:hypothetical protein